MSNVDPTRTTVLRRRFSAQMNKRFRRLRGLIRDAIVAKDVLALKHPKPLQLIERRAFEFTTKPEKVVQFKKWLQQQVDAEILTVNYKGEPWTNEYISSSYKKATIQSYVNVHKADLAQGEEFYKGSESRFLQEAFTAPESVEKLKLLQIRAFEELKGVTSSMSQQIGRVLAEGMAHGEAPETISRQMNNVVGKINRTRARAIARTEIIRAHAEGSLNAYEKLGIKELGLMVEWSTAAGACERCLSMAAGSPYTVKQARGLIPAHVNCKCSWVPAQKKKRN